MTWGAVAGAAVSVVGGAIAKNNGPKSHGSGSTQPASWYSDAGKAAGGRATDIMNRQYGSYLGDRIAGLGANEDAATSAAGSLGSQTQPYMDRLRAGFTPGALSQFTNPYTDSVLGARTRSIGEEYGRQSAALSQNQAATDAFRSGRSDLARSRLNADRIRALDDATNTTKSDAYDKGLAAYFNQNQNDIGALGATSNSELNRINALGATGRNERSVRQSQNDFNYGQFLERRDWDVNNLGPMLQYLQAAGPSAGATSTSTSEQRGGSNVGGMIGAAADIAGQFLSRDSGNGMTDAQNAEINNAANDPGNIPTMPDTGYIDVSAAPVG